MNINLLTITESQTNTWIDRLAIVISLISLVSTIILAIVTYWQNQKLKIVDLEADYFTKIYQDFLCDKLPQARASMKFLNRRLEGDQLFRTTLNDMRRNSAYFKYADEDFYEKVTNQLYNIEDYVVQENNHPPLDGNEESAFFEGLTAKIQELYQIISKRYHGK